MSRKFLIALIAVLMLCICLVIGSTGAVIWQWPNLSRATSLGALPTPTPSPVLVSPNTPASLPVTPLSAVSNATADALARAQIPARDLYQIVPRLRKNLALLTPMPTPAPRPRSIGDRDAFFVVEDDATGKYRTVNATLQIVTPNAYFWVEDNLKFDRAALQQSADFFERKVYPTNLKYFGNPGRGLDGETHIHILNTRLTEGTAGYFSSSDAYPRALVPNSNERNIIYMDAEKVPPSRNEYNGDLAHEFQHLIHHNQAKFATGWIDEGMGDLAIKVNGFPVLGVMETFARTPDTQLNTWGSTPQTSAAHYAASYLFFDYAAQRFGSEFIRDLIHAPREGIGGVQAVLDQRAGGLRFDDLFADWAVTNYLNDAMVENGRYAYVDENTFRIAHIPTLSQYPAVQAAQMSEYTASYYALQPAHSDVTIYFTGTTTAKLIAANAHSGQWMWYSNRADLSNMTLTRQFDLIRAPQGKATLQFWTWYDIEKNYDFGYVEVSTDGGKTWDILPGKHTTAENPNGANYGTGYSGRSAVSGDKPPAQWVQEQMDLSAYTGKTILLRFEYITDDAVNLPGWALDDITIPEINYSDDSEGGDGGWQAAGFIRADNVLPQRYIVQVVESGAATRVVRVPLDAQNRGHLTLAGFGTEISKAVLIVTAHAPTTTEPTEYQFGVAPR